MSRPSNNNAYLFAKHSVITFATNRLAYVKFALSCAQSILLHNDIRIFIVSNLDFSIPVKFKDHLFIIPPKPEHLSLGIGMKLYIDEYLQTEHTLFIDSDCMCFGNLGDIFTACKGMDVSVAGNIVKAENWCGEPLARVVKQNWGLDKLIRYNGGLYYVKQSAKAHCIFDKAREIAADYDKYGFDRIKNKWINEEPTLSIAMMLNNQKPVADNGSFMTDLFTDHRPGELNVLKGTRLLKNPSAPLPGHRAWYPAQYSPILLHFSGTRINSYPYISQSVLLQLNRMSVPVWVASVIVSMAVHFPFRVYHWFRRRLNIN
jgi:hypothetical protein